MKLKTQQWKIKQVIDSAIMKRNFNISADSLDKVNEKASTVGLLINWKYYFLVII